MDIITLKDGRKVILYDIRDILPYIRELMGEDAHDYISDVFDDYEAVDWAYSRLREGQV